MRFVTEGTYQGFPLTGWSIPRKPGLSPDTGWVEMPIENLKSLNVKSQFRPWVTLGKNGKAKKKEPPGPMHMGAALAILKAIFDTQVEERGGQKNEKGELRRGGPLTMTSQSLKGQPSEDQIVTLDPMFIHPSGIREQEIDLASAALHEEGTIRIAVMDIRYWWDKYGTPVYGNYNVTNKWGSFDEQYFIDKKPSPLGDFMKYLCLCLPGSPTVHPESDCFKGGLAHPQNIKMRFELPSVWLARLLEAYGMEIHLLRQSSVYISKRGGQHSPQFFTRFPGGDDTSIPLSPTYEKKTPYSVDVPEGVFVAGGQRQRRVTTLCEPAFTDEDGQVRRLSELPKLWNGYTVRQAMAQAVLGHEKAYEDVPHSDGKQWHNRAEIARRDFFKMYAPAWMFDTPKGTAVVSDFWNSELKTHPFMPMDDPVYSTDEFKLLATEEIALSKILPDAAGMVKLPNPLVKGCTIKRSLSSDLTDFRTKANAALKSLEARRDKILTNIRALGWEIAELNDGRPLWQAFTDPTLRGNILRSLNRFGLIDIDKLANLKEFTSDLFQGSIASIESDVQDDVNWNAARKTLAERANGVIDAFKKEIPKLATAILKVRENYASAFRSVERNKYARMWVNMPYGIVANASVEKETGIVRFPELAAVLDAPAVRDLETAKLVDDGNVTVTYMYKTKRNRPNDYGYWAFMAPDEPGGKIQLTEIDTPTGLKCAVVKDESLVIYEKEDGQPMNLGDVTEKACRMAGNILGSPRDANGYEYKYLGTWRVTTDEVQNEVQWVFDGDNAWTYIFANHPDGSQNGWDSLSKKRAKEELLYPYDYLATQAALEEARRGR